MGHVCLGSRSLRITGGSPSLQGGEEARASARVVGAACDNAGVSRYRLYPTGEQIDGLLSHCGHARYVWNLAVEQASYRVRGQRVPGYAEQDRQLTEARAAYPWLAEGSSTVQQQALRDHHRALKNWWSGTHRRPTWRKKGQHEGFRIVGAQARRVRQINRRWSEVLVPKVGWVRLRRTRAVSDARSYRITRDAAGRWHIAFAHVPDPVDGPGTGEVVGVDRGVAVAAMTSTGEALNVPGLTDGESRRLARLRRKAGRQRVRGRPASNRLRKTQMRINRLHARETDRRKDWVEQTSTELARRFDLIRVEDLRVADMTRSAAGTVAAPGTNVTAKSGLNRSILAAGWGALVRRLEDKAPYRVEKINPAYTSLCCSACGHVDSNSRKSQAEFLCTACGFASNADVNAATVIAAGGRPVTARGADTLVSAVKREPQHVASQVA